MKNSLSEVVALRNSKTPIFVISFGILISLLITIFASRAWSESCITPCDIGVQTDLESNFTQMSTGSSTTSTPEECKIRHRMSSEDARFCLFHESTASPIYNTSLLVFTWLLWKDLLPTSFQKSFRFWVLVLSSAFFFDCLRGWSHLHAPVISWSRQHPSDFPNVGQLVGTRR